MPDTKLRFRNIFMSVYILAIVALLVLPMLKYSINYVPTILFTVPFVFIYLMQKKKSTMTFLCLVLMLVFLFVFSFLINAPLNINAAMNMSIILYLCFVPYLLFDYLANTKSKWEIQIVLVGIISIFVFIVFMTSRAFADDPVIARRLAIGSADDEYINEMRMKNIGGFGFSYAVGMLIPYVAIKIVNSAGKTKALLIALFIALFVYAFFCQYTMLLILAITFSTIVFIIGSKSIITKTLLLFSSLVILINLAGIFKFLGNNLPLVSLAYHFRGLYTSLSTGEDTTSRILATKRCLGLFRQHPFFGVNILDSYNSYIIGHGHSLYFPFLSSNGIFGLGMLFVTTFYIFRSIYLRINANRMNIIVLIMYVVLGFLNPTHNAFEISVSVFLLIPLIEYYENKIKEQEYEE